MKLAINIALSLLMLGICTFLVWPSPDELTRLENAFTVMDWNYLLGFVAFLAVVHLTRTWRWHYLLVPIGARLSFARLFAVSSVGFMAILALPARLGEFVRPALVRERGQVSASAALGTVAVERIIDGLVISILVFSAFSMRRGPDAPYWMMPTAYAALALFSAAMIFLLLAMRGPEKTVDLALRLSLIQRLAPRVAAVLREKLLSMISGFFVLRDARNLLLFLLWTAVYWAANGAGMWVLARGFGLELSLVGSFATMSLVAVGITLPNSPGLVGQYQWFTQLGLSLYVGAEVGLGPEGLAYAIVLHGVQVVWYIGMGGLALSSRHVSMAELWQARSLPDSLSNDNDDNDSSEPRP